MAASKLIGRHRLRSSRQNRGVTEIPVIPGKSVLEAIDPATAVERTRLAFERYARGEWEMPAKVYLDSPPYGDFRAMPARGDGLAMLKWIASFPGNPQTAGLPAGVGVGWISHARAGPPPAPPPAPRAPPPAPPARPAGPPR